MLGGSARRSFVGSSLGEKVRAIQERPIKRSNFETHKLTVNESSYVDYGE